MPLSILIWLIVEYLSVAQNPISYREHEERSKFQISDKVINDFSAELRRLRIIIRYHELIKCIANYDSNQRNRNEEGKE